MQVSKKRRYTNTIPLPSKKTRVSIPLILLTPDEILTLIIYFAIHHDIRYIMEIKSNSMRYVCKRFKNIIDTKKAVFMTYFKQDLKYIQIPEKEWRGGSKYNIPLCGKLST